MKNPWIMTAIAVALMVLVMVTVLLLGGKTQPPQNTQPTTVPTTEATAESTQTTTVTEATQAPTVTTEATEPVMLEKYQSYYEQNDHLVGWMRLPGANIDNPVLQTARDNTDYYLERGFDRKYSAAGSLYVREFCDVFGPSDNVVIYGHNMKNGTMFGSLRKYLNQSFWEQNQYIYFDTLYGEHTYQIFAVFAISADLGNYPYHRFNDAASPEEFDEFIQIVTNGPKADPAITKTITYYCNSGITPQYGDKLITLSTCEYTKGDNGRLVVVAYRVS